jgi:eukaryotic-like serine/threonine-protein kinase
MADVEQVIADLVDRAPIDWLALEGEISTPQDREWLKALRVIADIAAFRSEISGDTLATTTGVQRPLADEEQHWGKYVLVERVGEGGFGRVYRAWDPDLELEVAIKILHRRVSDLQLKAALLAEGRALAKVQHPNVVRVLSIESRADEIALRMEFVHGETLDEIVHRNGPMSAREAAVVGEDVCRALSAVHLAGFVHRDVKAKNVMRENAGRIVLMDFGAGRQADELKVPGLVNNVGTPLYMAPEVLVGQPASALSDVYSVGVLLYYMATGRFPVEGQSADEITRAHLRGHRVALGQRRADLPSAFVHVVEQALASDPAQRYASVSAVGADLARLSARSRWSTAKTIAMVAGTSLAFVFTSGFLTSAWYNLITGRRGRFASESPMVWLELGVRSLVSPLVYIGLMLLALAVVRFVLRVAAGLIRRTRAGTVLSTQWNRIVARVGLRDAGIWAQVTTVAGTVALIGIVIRFSQVLRASASIINDAPAIDLLPLEWSLARGVEFSGLRVALDALIVGLVAATMRVKRLHALQGAPGMAPLGAPLTLIALAVLFLEVPYRIGWHARGERVTVGSERCYVLGTSGAQALAFCPDSPVPRNRVVDLTRIDLTRSGLVEEIFTPADSLR